MNNECTQKETIATLRNDNKYMTKKLDKIDIKMENIVLKIDKLTEHILVMPQKYADKKEFEEFRNGINFKIAWVLGAFTVVSTIIGFLLNKYF